MHQFHDNSRKVAKLTAQKKDNESLQLTMFYLFFLCCVLIAIGYIFIVKKYEHESHNENAYIESSYYSSVVVKAIELCRNNHTSSRNHIEKCNVVNEQVKLFAGLADLRAQQTMATATRGILFSAYLQYVVGVLTLGFIGLTLWATWEVLTQAHETTRFAGETLDEAMIATGHAKDSVRAAEDSADAAREATEASIKAQKAHVLPLMNARFDSIDFGGSGILSGTLRIDKSKVIISISVGNLGKTPVRGGHINTRNFVGRDAGETRYPFKALADGELVESVVETELYTSDLIGEKARTTYEIYTSTTFTDIDGVKSPLLIAWGDVRLMSKGKVVSYDALRRMSVPERINSYDGVRVEVTYEELFEKKC